MSRIGVLWQRLVRDIWLVAALAIGLLLVGTGVYWLAGNGGEGGGSAVAQASVTGAVPLPEAATGLANIGRRLGALQKASKDGGLVAELPYQSADLRLRLWQQRIDAGTLQYSDISAQVDALEELLKDDALSADEVNAWLSEAKAKGLAE